MSWNPLGSRTVIVGAVMGFYKGKQRGFPLPKTANHVFSAITRPFGQKTGFFPLDRPAWEPEGNRRTVRTQAVRGDLQRALPVHLRSCHQNGCGVPLWAERQPNRELRCFWVVVCSRSAQTLCRVIPGKGRKGGRGGSWWHGSLRSPGELSCRQARESFSSLPWPANAGRLPKSPGFPRPSRHGSCKPCARFGHP